MVNNSPFPNFASAPANNNLKSRLGAQFAVFSRIIRERNSDLSSEGITTEQMLEKTRCPERESSPRLTDDLCTTTKLPRQLQWDGLSPQTSWTGNSVLLLIRGVK